MSQGKVELLVNLRLGQGQGDALGSNLPREKNDIRFTLGNSCLVSKLILREGFLSPPCLEQGYLSALEFVVRWGHFRCSY